MNENFRKPEFVKRYEYNCYDLATPLNSIVANNATQITNNYRFEVDNSSESNPIDWYNAYLEVDFKLVRDDNGQSIVGGIDADTKFCTTTNGQTFIKEIKVDCDGISMYHNSKANETSNVLSLLKYTKSYADTVGKDPFFYLDTSSGTAEPQPDEDLYNEGFAKRKKLTDDSAVNKISIPLNLYSYFAAFKNNLQPNLKTIISLELEEDESIIFKHANAPRSKVILTKLRLWVPKIIFNETGMDLHLKDYLKPKKWTYLKEQHEIKESNTTSDAFRIST